MSVCAQSMHYIVRLGGMLESIIPHLSVYTHAQGIRRVCVRARARANLIILGRGSLSAKGWGWS